MKKCKYCGAEIEQFEHRDDKNYCDKSSCRSKYHQEVGRGYRGFATSHLLHKDLEWVHGYICLECGDSFAVNDYAERSGKREPMYCSAKCKQKAYRKRKKLLSDIDKG